MLLRLGLPVRIVSASGLGDSCFSAPVADATGRDVPASGLRRLQPGGRHILLRLGLPVRNVSASGLKRLLGIEAPVADAHRQGCVGLRPEGF